MSDFSEPSDSAWAYEAGSMSSSPDLTNHFFLDSGYNTNATSQRQPPLPSAPPGNYGSRTLPLPDALSNANLAVQRAQQAFTQNTTPAYVATIHSEDSVVDLTDSPPPPPPQHRHLNQSLPSLPRASSNLSSLFSGSPAPLGEELYPRNRLLESARDQDPRPWQDRTRPSSPAPEATAIEAEFDVSSDFERHLENAAIPMPRISRGNGEGNLTRRLSPPPTAHAQSQNESHRPAKRRRVTNASDQSYSITPSSSRPTSSRSQRNVNRNPDSPPEEIDLTDVNDESSLATALSRQRAEAVASQRQPGESLSGRTALTSYKCPICLETPENATITMCGKRLQVLYSLFASFLEQ